MFMNQIDLLERHGLRPSGVLHVGASEGQEIELYHAAGIPKQIHVEALPDVYSRLASKAAAVPGAEAINACISDTPARGVTFNVASNGGQSSSLLEFGTHRTLHPQVEFVDRLEVNTVRLDQLPIDWAGIDYLVTDLQGCDLRAIRSAGDFLEQIEAIYAEVYRGEVYLGNDLVKDMDEYLSAKGFHRVETTWVKLFWGDAFYVRKPR